MKVLLTTVLVLIVVGNADDDDDDKVDIPTNTLVIEANGKEVVVDVVEAIRESDIFPEDYNFTERVVCIESNNGNHPNTYREGYHGGIWQVDEVGYEATKDISSHPDLVEKHRKIKEKFGIDWMKTSWEDLRKPFYSGLAARLYLSNIPEAIPADVEEQAKYWKKHYNTSKGKGKEKKFVVECK